MKLGMVFEGGASRTIFSCGVADAFLEENIMPDYFIGVSAGIAFGLSYLSKQHGRNLELARKYNVSVPIIEAVNQVLFEGKPAIDGMWELMEREQTNEYRDLQWDE